MRRLRRRPLDCAVPPHTEAARRDPAPEACPERLYALTANDLEDAPSSSEAHRKLRARLRDTGVHPPLAGRFRK